MTWLFQIACAFIGYVLGAMAYHIWMDRKKKKGKKDE